MSMLEDRSSYINVSESAKDTDSDDEELEAHYMYMAQLQEVTPDQVDNSGPIFDDEPIHKVQDNNDNYNVFAMDVGNTKSVGHFQVVT
ncbi:hypothetical protein Tco_1332687, partial [Tanacetum coccineum]